MNSKIIAKEPSILEDPLNQFKSLKKRFPESPIFLIGPFINIWVDNIVLIANKDEEILATFDQIPEKNFPQFLINFSQNPAPITKEFLEFIIKKNHMPDSEFKQLDRQEQELQNTLKSAASRLFDNDLIYVPPHVVMEIEDNYLQETIMRSQQSTYENLLNNFIENKSFLEKHFDQIEMVGGYQGAIPPAYSGVIRSAQLIIEMMPPPPVSSLESILKNHELYNKNISKTKVAGITLFFLSLPEQDMSDRFLHWLGNNYDHEALGRAVKQPDGSIFINIIESEYSRKNSANLALVSKVIENISDFSTSEIEVLLEKLILKETKTASGKSLYRINSELSFDKYLQIIKNLDLSPKSRNMVIQMIEERWIFHSHPLPKLKYNIVSRNLPSGNDFLVQAVGIVDQQKIDYRTHRIYTPDFVIKIHLDLSNLEKLKSARNIFELYENLDLSNLIKSDNDKYEQFMSARLADYELEYTFNNLPEIGKKIFGFEVSYKKITEGAYKYSQEPIKFQEPIKLLFESHPPL